MPGSGKYPAVRLDEEIEETLVREIQDRGNNLLFVIQAIAHQTLSGSRSLAEAKKVFDVRLQALARAKRQLNEANWSRVNLNEIVHSALAPFGERATVAGVDVMLVPQHVQNFSLALHELATNAAKYGALSNESGKVDISWRMAGGEKDDKLIFTWKERGWAACHCADKRWFRHFADVRISYLVEGSAARLISS